MLDALRSYRPEFDSRKIHIFLLCAAVITEAKFRLEEKFQKAQHLPSFHNFIVASNTMKAVEICAGERRFFPLKCVKINYSKQDREKQWALVHDDNVREIFFHYLNSIDTSKIVIGEAPFTDFKQQMQAQQAPAAIKWLKHVVLSDLENMCNVPNMFCNNDSDRMNVQNMITDNGLFKLQRRPGGDCFNRLATNYEEVMLSDDLKNRSKVKVYVPARHVAAQVQGHFKGQAYRAVNEDETLQTLSDLGLKVDVPRKIAGKSTRCVEFPSVEGIKYMLMDGHWMTKADDAAETDD